MPATFRPTYAVFAHNFNLPRQTNESRYQGSHTSKASRDEVPGLPDFLNTVLHVTNIPTTVDSSDLFNIIKCGKVISLHMIPPNGAYTTQAAKIVFNQPYESKAFFDLVKAGVFMGGHRLRIFYNRHALRGGRYNSKSRVVIIEGPDELMTLDFWDGYFRQFCLFDYDYVGDLECRFARRKKMEFRFVRIDGQAEPIHDAIWKNKAFRYIFTVGYGRDPCDPSYRH